MGSNGAPKKRGMGHHLHKQYIATKSGKEQHNEAVKRERALPVKPRVIKCKYSTNTGEDVESDEGKG